MVKRTNLHDLEKLVISKNGHYKIKQFKNLIEPDLVDGGKYSHIALRGAASKSDMQIMKISSILHLFDKDVAITEHLILDKHVDSAIGITHELLEAGSELNYHAGWQRHHHPSIDFCFFNKRAT